MLGINPSLCSTPRRGRWSQDEGGDGASPRAWTAAHCDALLTALNTRVDLLRKDGAKFLEGASPTKGQTVQDVLQGTDMMNLKRKSRTTYTKRARRGDSRAIAPGQRTKRSSSLATPTRASGETWGATPFLRHDQRTQDTPSANGRPKNANSEGGKESPHASSHLASPTNDSAPSQYRVKQILKQAESALTVERYSRSLHVCEAYQALLRSTTSDVRPEPSKSLLSMCLRAMPSRMKLEHEHLESIETKTLGMKLVTPASNVSSEMYAEIRDMDLSANGGQHVRTILQAHGTEIVRDAMTDGVLSQEFSIVAVLNCIQMGCILEAEVLLAAMLSRIQRSAPASFSSQPNGAYLALDEYATYGGCIGAYFRMLTDALSYNRLPIQWLATKDFQKLWPRLYSSLAADAPHRKDAQEFCKVALRLLSSASATPTDGISIAATFISLLSSLCSIVLTGSIRRNALKDQLRISVDDVLGSFMVDLGRSNGVQRLYALALGDLLNPLTAYKTIRDGLQSLLSTVHGKDMDILRPTLGSISNLVCSVLGRCERARSGFGLQQVQELCGVIEASSTLRHSSGQILWTAILDGIRAFNLQLPDTSEATVAKQMTHALFAGFKSNSTPDAEFGSSNQCSSQLPEALEVIDDHAGCRWEEGIEEWVAVTPASGEAPATGLSPFNEEAESPLAPYRVAGRIRATYSSKRKQPTTATRSYSFLDLVPPSSPGGSDTEPETSLMSDITTYSDRIENPSGRPDITGCIRLRTPLPPNFNGTSAKAPYEGDMHDLESSGDELGY